MIRSLTAAVAGALLIAGSLPLGSGEALANSGFEQSIQSMYDAYEEKVTQTYAADKQRVQKEFQTFLDESDEDYRLLHDQTNADYESLQRMLDDDGEELESRYDSDDTLRKYLKEIDGDYLNSSMWEYKKAIDGDYLNSDMWEFKTDIDEDYLNSPMWEYENAIDPDYLNSALWEYENEVDPDYLNSALWEFENDTDPNYAGSIMNRYKRGKLSQAEAQKLIDEAKERTDNEISATRKAMLAKIESIRANTVKTVTETKTKSTASILDKRSDAEATISAIRKQLTGTGISFPALVLATREIKVIIDGEIQSFDQAPIQKNGTTLVPMRAIFEKLGATIVWNAKDQSVTATKEDTSIYLKIGSKTAKVNGSSVALAVPAQIVDGSTMVPLRFIGEALGAEVKWDAGTRSVIIATKA